jgi:hypothetical protein
MTLDHLTLNHLAVDRLENPLGTDNLQPSQSLGHSG